MYSSQKLKEYSAQRAVEYVKSGMLLGLGTGSTAKLAVDFLHKKIITEKLEIKATPTSRETEKLMAEYGIEKVELKDIKPDEIDITIDGADQVDLATGVCIKGGGGAHFWEKQIARLSKSTIIIVDETKVVTDFVGCKIPLEVDPMKIAELKNKIPLTVRENLSDFENTIADAVYTEEMAKIYSIYDFEKYLMGLEGVIDTGIFINIAKKIIIAYNTGEVKEYTYG